MKNFPADVMRMSQLGPIVGIDAEGREEDVSSRVRAALSARWPGTFPGKDT